MTKKTYSKRGKLIIDCTSLEQSSAAKVIAGNADLLTEILFRVPAKSLIRFKCVSKHWLSLISDSQFTSDHARLNLRSSISGLYFYLNRWSRNHNVQLESVSVDGHPSLPTLSFLDAAVAGFTIRIEDSCNGLMLCSNACGRLAYVVCNPTTKKYTVLPGPDRPPYKTSCKYLGAFLAFDPSKSPHYKVFLFNYFYPGDGHCYEIEIYRSESSSWKYMRVAAPPGEQFAFRVFWNGAIHWISYEELDIRHIRFEVESEKLIETPMPQNPKILSQDKIRYFGECGGHLLLIQTRQRFAMGFRILEMDRECCHWIVKCRVNLRPILSVFPEIVCTTITRSCKFNVLCVVKGANEKDFTLVLAIPGKVISYNLKSKTSKDLRDLSPGELDDGGATWYNTYQFIESLTPV